MPWVPRRLCALGNRTVVLGSNCPEPQAHFLGLEVIGSGLGETAAASLKAVLEIARVGLGL